MPRPGPRPYECVRRAWHSERHQPIRGSVIQQIFRVVHDTHAAQTKKNREWQEKHPIVVFKAEEIMYSKANSEAEYMNLDTLWDRVNDAINTIIRRDESTETGELLPPCVEVRASRSQRHSNPRTYLNLRPQESASMPPRIVDKTIEQCPELSPLNTGNQLNFVRPPSKANSTLQASETNCYAIKNDNLAAHKKSYPLYENVLPVHTKMMTMEANIPLKLGSVYPLYYGTHCQAQGSKIPENMNSTPVFVGKPVGTSILESAEVGVLPNLLSDPTSDMASKTVSQPDFGDTYKMPLVTECDLSLRLGQFSDPCMSIDRSSARETEAVGSSSYQETNKFSNPSLKNKEFCFFPGKTVNDPSESCSRTWFSEGEYYCVEGSTRKTNVPVGDKLEDVKCGWQPGLPSNQRINRIKGPGL